MAAGASWQLIKPYADIAGVPGIAPHDVRRTCAKLCRAGGGELEQIQLRGFGPPMAGAELAKQPQTKGAEGDQERHYYFEAAKQEMPYHLVVPQKYDGKTKMPLVVALHGYGGNQDYFSALVKNLPELCEQYGFIFVAPMGYSTGGWYGAPLSIPGNRPRAGGKQPPPRRLLKRLPMSANRARPTWSTRSIRSVST